MYELPTTKFSRKYDFIIAGINLTASLAYTSLNAGTVANYTLTTQTLQRSGILSIEIPQYITDLFNGNDVANTTDDTIR